jgi:diaminopropionate ammonia-lyase
LEEGLLDALRLLASSGGPATTPSGPAGLAGLSAALSRREEAKDLGLDRSSRVLILVTERALD